MKKYQFAKISMTVCLVLGMIMMPFGQLKVQAAEVIATVQGTVMSGTTSDLLLLSTNEGKMEIKLDSNTDSSGCKILLIDKKISVAVTHGSDGYLHAARITSEAKLSGVKLDSSTSTVTGTISEKTLDDVIFLNTAQGEMQIKFDLTTTMNGCSVLVMGRNYSITCARGADAYMHAISITDPSVASTTVSSPSHVAAMSVNGTVSDKTTESILHLHTKEGTMQFKIDSDADTSRGMILIPEKKLTVSFYHGSDGYLHAVGLAGDKDSSSSVNIDTANTSTVTGTVESKSTENKLFLKTAQGTMELKLDAVNSAGSSKVVLNGMKVSVSCARGSDAYMHALTITKTY